MALQWSSRWEQQRWLARGQKSYWWVLADNSSLLCFGLPQADTISISSVIIQKSSAAACLSRMLKDLEATCCKGQSWQGKGAADPLWGMHLCPCFWKLTGDCEFKEKVCKVLRGLLECVALNLFLQHAVIGLTWEKQLRNKWEESVKG